MSATPQNVEMEAAKFLHKLIQESTDEPTKLATKLHVILQHMRSSGKENSMPYQVISRAMETVINRHGLDVEALVSTRQPLTGGAQVEDSSLSQIAGSSQQIAMEKDSRKTAEEMAKIPTFSGKPLLGPNSAGLDIYQGSASQLNTIKSHGINAGVSGSYESTEQGNPISMQLSNSYDNQSASTLMHKDRRTETFSTPSLGDQTSGKGPTGKALEHEGGYPNMMANVNQTVQGGISNNVTEMGTLRNEASRDTGKLPVIQAPAVGSGTPFKEHHLKQLRAQCLVFLAFRNNLMPKKLHLEIALGNFFPKEDVSSKEHIDQKGKEQSIGSQSFNPEAGMHSARVDNARETERRGPGSSVTGFIPETKLLKEAEKLDRVVDKNDLSSGLSEHGEGLRNNLMPRKLEAETQALETKESLMSATKIAHPNHNAVPIGMEGHRSGHGHLPGFPLRESWKSHSGMEGERHMVVPKSANASEKDALLGNNHEEEDNRERSPSQTPPKYTTSEKWISDFQKRKAIAEYSWGVKKKKTEQRISVCTKKLKEAVSSSEDISAKTRSVIELKKLELLELQRRLRNEILNDFFKPISTELDRLKSIKKHRVGRRTKQLERYEQKMKEERQKRIRERQKDFFSEMESHKERLEDVFKIRRERIKGFNRYAREFHKKKERLHREKIDRIQREKINLLKINDVEGYLRMVQDAKSDRVKQLLKETEKYLQKLGSKLKEAKAIGRCFESDASDGRLLGVNESSEFTIENEDETDQAKHYMESNEKYYMMAHSIKETVAEQPATLVGGKLREYQMNGLRWLLSLYNNHLNGILADEMGLGKTVQVISLLCYLMENKNDRGPFLVVVPSSVLPGWESEINFWAPSINKIVYAGPPEERRRLFKELIVQQKFNVLLTTYEYLMNKHDRPKLSKIHWHYVIIDEGHRIKNASCKLNADLKHYHSSHRLLLTGTPLQNNLEELWALLNFLLPNIFNSSEDFSQWFNKPFESNADSSLEEALLSEEENLLIINRLHQVLRPFVLRRLKHKVENQLPEKIERLVRCEASAYQKLLMQRVEDNRGAFGSLKARAVHNSVVELRNICNHPYLSQLHTEQVHDFIPKHYLPNVVRLCGKLEMLDRLLPKLKATDHRVLLFSTMTRLLDVMEDYLYWKQYKYLRLDGHTSGGDRGALIDEFNRPGSPFFIFLLSIRAGGVGVNLQAADTVIIFDTDWNPQVDLQAQARAHRIGQKKDVLVLRLETVQTIEEQVRASAEHKLGVANQSITAGFFDNNTSAEDRREYLEALLRECKKEEAAPVLNDDALNDLIARRESEIDVFEDLDKKRQEEEMIIWKKLVSEQGGISAEHIPPLPSRLVTDDELKSFCESMKAIEVPRPVMVSGVGGKRKSESIGSFDTQQYGRGKRAREVRSYEEQWTEDEFEKLCQVEEPDSPNRKEEGRDKDLSIFADASSVAVGVKTAVLPNPQQTRPSEELPVQTIITPPSKRGRGRPKKNPMVIPSPPAPSTARIVAGSVHPLGIQIAPSSQPTPGLSASNLSLTDGNQSTATLTSASGSTPTAPPGFQPTPSHPPGFQPMATPPGYQPTTTAPPGYPPKTSPPPGYQQLATPPPGFQPKATPPVPLAGSQAATSLPSGPQSTPAVPTGSQPTPSLPSASLSTPTHPGIPSVSQSNTVVHSTTIFYSNLPPGTQSSSTFPLVSTSSQMLPPFSPGSQSAISPVVTPGRGRGRGRGRPRGRGRGRGQIMESAIDVSQPPGRRKNIGNAVDVSQPPGRTTNTESRVDVSQPMSKTTNTESGLDVSQPPSKMPNTESGLDVSQPPSKLINTESGLDVSQPPAKITNTESGLDVSQPQGNITNTESGVDVSQPQGELTNTESGLDVSQHQGKLTNTESGVDVSQSRGTSTITESRVDVSKPPGNVTNTESGLDVSQLRGRMKNTESGVDGSQTRGRSTNNVVLAIPGVRASSAMGKPATGSVVPSSSSKTVPEASVSGSTSIKDDTDTKALGTVIPPPCGTPKSNVESPKTAAKDTPSVAISNVVTGIGGAVLEPDVATTQTIPTSLPFSVSSQSTAKTPPLATVPLGSQSLPLSDSEPKQGRGRGRRAQSGVELPRRRLRRKEDVVDGQGSNSNEPPEKKTRLSGRKTVATRSMLRNAAQKNLIDASTPSDNVVQSSNLPEKSHNSSRAKKEQSSTISKTDILAKSSDTGTVDDRKDVLDTSGEKVVESEDSMITQAVSKTHEATENFEPKKDLDSKKLADLGPEEREGPQTINSGTPETREPKPSKEVESVSHGGDNSSQQVEATELEVRERGCSVHDADQENKNEVLEAENAKMLQVEERDPTIKNGGMIREPDASEENVVEIAQDPRIPVQQPLTGDGVKTRATTSKKIKEISQGRIEHEKKEQGTGDPTRENVDDLVETPLEPPVEQCTLQSEKEDPVNVEGGPTVKTNSQLSEVVEDAPIGETTTGGISDVAENDDEKTKNVPVGQGEMEGVETIEGSLGSSDVKPSEKVGVSVKGENKQEKQETAGSDACGGLKENVTEQTETTEVSPVITGKKEDKGNIDDGTLVETDTKPSEKTDGAHPVETEPNKSEQSGDATPGEGGEPDTNTAATPEAADTKPFGKVKQAECEEKDVTTEGLSVGQGEGEGPKESSEEGRKDSSENKDSPVTTDAEVGNEENV